MNSVEMYKGERRTVGVEFQSCNYEAFTINNPTYKLKYGDTVEAEGIPVLEEHELIIVLEPANVGRYVLECQIEVAEEVVIRRIPVYVRE